MSERPTVRPVTLARLTEATHLCEGTSRTTDEFKEATGVSRRRARTTILEALRIGLIAEHTPADDEESWFMTTRVGHEFLKGIRAEDWLRVSDILEARSPHYGAFLTALDSVAPADQATVLDELADREAHTGRTYNQTSIEVLGDWGERLGRIQRNAFTGTYYPVTQAEVPGNFVYLLLAVFDDLEETAGVALRQRYLAIPKLREHLCERVGCPRMAFDDAVVAVAQQNVGRLELSGAPIDTAAKDAALGIKQITRADNNDLVSTSQSTEQVLAGVELYDKRYYYLAVHDRELSYNPAQ
ncbi:hypothetical protein [Halomarina oriensis]|uniref:Uncharacterized protein n=1 Tax=Halomarina oriensis TaxID=671145 RepID=A0A6B0GMG9_9EURY|nr:hypothetical protein [Halomarina oriensis]MWG36106.1 hypothetical protein [Halomarina oriensis]